VRGDRVKIEGGTAVKETVSVAPAVTAQEAVLPARVQEALGELVGAAKEGLLALSVATGLGVLVELLEDEVDDVVGPKGKRNPDRVAVRHGHEAGEVTLGGRRVAVERPRARTVDGEHEVPLATYDAEARPPGVGAGNSGRLDNNARSAECHPACPSASDPCGLASEVFAAALAWTGAVTGALLLCHRCRSEKGVDRAPADVWSSSIPSVS
jgi:hypothetical protein